MKKKPSTLPRGYRTLTTSLAVSDVAAASKFLQTAFEAEFLGQDNNEEPGFAALKIGNAQIFVTLGWAAHGHAPVDYFATSPVSMHMYSDDVDAATIRAVDAGATQLSAPTDMYWGERCSAIVDPFGHRWTIATRQENLSLDEIALRRNPEPMEAVIVEGADVVLATE